MSEESPGGRGRGNALAQFSRWVLGIGYERNVGGPERTLRYVFGAVSALAGLAILGVPIVAGALANGLLAAALLVTGAYLIYEARVQYCPLTSTLGRSTYAEP